MWVEANASEDVNAGFHIIKKCRLQARRLFGWSRALETLKCNGHTGSVMIWFPVGRNTLRCIWIQGGESHIWWHTHKETSPGCVFLCCRPQEYCKSWQINLQSTCHQEWTNSAALWANVTLMTSPQIRSVLLNMFCCQLDSRCMKMHHGSKTGTQAEKQRLPRERERGEGRGRSVGISENLAENYWTAAKQYVSVSDMSGRILPRLILFELVRSFGLISSSSLLSKCTLRKLKVFLYTVWKQRRVSEETHLVNKWMKYVFAYDVWLTLKHLRLTLNSELVLKLVLVPTFFVSFL